MTESLSSSNSGNKESNWYHKHLSGTGSSNIWILYKQFKVLKDRNGTKMAAPIKEVTNTISFNMSKWMFDTGTSSHMIQYRNCFKLFLSV
jgi:hypothetical protein